MFFSNNGYYFYFDKLSADNIDDIYTFTVMSSDTQVSETLTYSAASYIALAKDNENLSDLVLALAAYGRSALAYSQK